MNDERKKPIPLWPDGCVWILCSSSIGAILKIFLTPIDTSGNDIGAGLGNLIVHPVVHGSIGAVAGAFIGSLGFFLFRNLKQSELSPIIQNTPTTPPLNAEESAKVIETAIRKAAKKSTGELNKADFKKVIVMDLQDKGLTSVKCLEKLTQLTDLHLLDNQLTDVKGLEKLTKLEALQLQNNQLTDVTGLEKLTQLKYLILAFNPALTKAQIDELQKALPKCRIEHTATK